MGRNCKYLLRFKDIYTGCLEKSIPFNLIFSGVILTKNLIKRGPLFPATLYVFLLSSCSHFI